MKNLYIVATPIGNLQDISLRASKTLLDMPIIIAESTSKAGILLNFLEKEFAKKRVINQTIISFTEAEEENKVGTIIRMLEQGDAALISEAGTPLISDPGFKLVREAAKRGVRIIPVPGPTAAIAALSVSGLPTDKFLFLGFLSKSKTKKESMLRLTCEMPFKTTIIIYESPDRLLDTLAAIHSILGNIDLVICRELTKFHEETIRGKITDAILQFKREKPKGELVILFQGI